MEALKPMSGKLKVVLVVLSIITLGIMADIYDQTSDETLFHNKSNKGIGGTGKTSQEDLINASLRIVKKYKENINLAATAIAFVAALAFLISAFVNKGKNMATNIEAGIHIVVGAFLFVGWVLYVVEVKDVEIVVDYYKPITLVGHGAWFGKAICVLIAEAVEVLLFFVTAFLVIKKK